MSATPANLTAIAAAFHAIRNVETNLCLHAEDNDSISQKTCVAGEVRQLWAPLSDGGTIYHFQNALSELCIWAIENPIHTVQVNTLILQGGCNSCGGKTCSDATFNTGASLPNVVVLQSHDSFKDQGVCVDGGNRVNGLMQTCNGSLRQKWIIGF